MGIFFNRENRGYNPGLESSDAFLTAFPNHIVTAANLSWTEYQALRSSDIFIACTTIAKDIARLDIKIKEKGIYKEKDRLENLLNNRSNEIYNGYSLKFSTMLAALLTGAGYILIERVNNTPVALYHIPTSRIQLKQNRDDGSYYYEVNNNGKTEKIDYEDIIAIKPFVDDGLNTLSILDSLKDDLDTNNYSKKFFRNYFANGTQAGSVLKMKDGKLSPEARKKIKEEWQKANSGDNGINGTIVLDETMDFSKIEVNTDILKLITANKSSTVSIAAAFGLPPHKLGLESPNTSMQDQANEYLFNTLSAYMKVWTSELNYKLLSSRDDYKKELVFDTSAYRSIDWNSYVDTLLRELDKGSITLNEYRFATGRPPVKGGDENRVDLNHISLEIADDYQLRETTTNNQSIEAISDTVKQPTEESNTSQGGEISEQEGN